MSSAKRVRILALILSIIMALDFGAVRASAETEASETEETSAASEMGPYGAANYMDADMASVQETVDDLDPEKEQIVQFAPGIDLSQDSGKRYSAPVSAADLRREIEQLSEMTEEEREDHQMQYSLIGTIALAKTSMALNIRKDADPDADIIGRLYQGTGAFYGGVKGNWTFITSGGISGWVSSRYILSGESAEAIYGEMNPMVAFSTTDNLSVRREPSVESELMARINRGDHYPVLEIDGDWVLIQVSSHEQGYVSAEYVTVTKGLDTAKTIIEDEAMEASIAKIEAERQAAIEAAREAAQREKEEREREEQEEREREEREREQQRREEEENSDSSSNNSGSSSSSSSGSSSSSSGSSSSSSSSSGSSSSSSGSSSGSSSSSSSGSSSSSRDDDDDDDDGMAGWHKVGTCRLSSYCRKCNSPVGTHTYTGVKAVAWKTIAVDPDVIPLGSTVYIEGYGTFKAQDTGVSGKWIDLFVNPKECHIWAKATVYYK